MFGNYLGFWLLGTALIAVGMLGSLLTANMAIAFALGAVLCALLVFVDVAAAVFSPTWQRIVAPLGVVSHFRDFSDGVVSLSALLYFLSVTGSFLYLNVLIVGRRHWLPPSGGLSMGAHHAVRALAAVTLVVCVNAVVARASARLDVTAERLHTLTDQTHQLLGELSAERPVLIRAFISPTVPEAYVQTRATLLGLLREIDVLAGPNVQLLIEETEPYTDAAVDAQDTFGITARPGVHRGGPSCLAAGRSAAGRQYRSRSLRAAGGSRNPFMAQNQPPPLPKGNVQGLLADLGVRWDSSAVAWDAYNPHPDLAHLPPEVIFVGEGSDSNAPFNQEHRASAGLQELRPR